jgi:hypothetical protein
MRIPSGIGIIDLMLGIPREDESSAYQFLRPLLLDRESRQVFSKPIEYLFKFKL